MSLLAKTTFWSSCVISAAMVGYVHFEQHSDRSKLHEGVIRDMERQELRRQENQQQLEQQIELTEKLQKQLDESENKKNHPGQ